MKTFRPFALITTIAGYLLIFMGGLVRVSGAGLGCPDWPTCFGRWLPPTSVNQLPPEIDPGQFNFTLAWIEYIHRLIGFSVGLLVVVTALLAIKNFRNVPRILWPSVAAAVLIAVEGGMASFVVRTELEPTLVTLHMLLAFVVISLLVFATLQAYMVQHPQQNGRAGVLRGTSRWIIVLWILAILQVILGTQMRAALAAASERMPLAAASQWLREAGAIYDIHLLIGLIVAAVTIYIGVRISKVRQSLSATGRQSVAVAMVLVVVQVMVGLSLIFTVAPVLQVFHLWVASLYIGALTVLYSTIARPNPALQMER